MGIYTDFEGKHSEIKVESAKLYEECGTYFLSIHYIIDDETEKREFFIPRVRLPIDAPVDIIYDYKDKNESSLLCDHERIHYLKLADGTELPLQYAIEKEFPKGVKLYAPRHAFVCRTIETKEKEMTLDEIEKKLGHKIKIINK